MSHNSHVERAQRILLGFLAARLHLHVFDTLFFRHGSPENYKKQAES